MKVIRILEIIPSLNVGGAERFVVDLCNQLVCEDNLHVTLLILYDLNGPLLPFVNSKVKLLSLNKKKGFSISFFNSLYQAIKSEKVDIVHMHTTAISHVALFSYFFRKKKFFATIHSEAKREAGNIISTAIRKLVFKTKVCSAITISESSQNSFEDFYHCYSYLIKNGRPFYKFISDNKILKEYKTSDSCRIFVNVASIQPVKNQIMLVNVFDRLLEDGYELCLLLIGRNADENIYRELKLKSNRNIILLGEYNNPREFLEKADGFCLSSLQEGMPISLIEAFSVGCIPFCTPAGGCVNMIENGVNGFIATDFSEESYYRMIKKYLSISKSQIKKIKMNSLKTFNDQFDIKLSAKNHINLFNTVIDNRNL